MRVSRPAVRPIVLPVALPTVPRVAVFGSRTPVTFSAGRLVVFIVPIVLPIRELDFTVREGRLVSDCFFAAGTEGVLLPITVPMFRLLSLRSDDRLPFTLCVVEELLELTAGCFAFVGAEELRVPIVLPIREVLLELTAGCLAPLGTDGLVVLIVPPIREVMLGLILLLVLAVDLLIVMVFELLLPGDVIVFREELLGLIELPIRDVMLELILPFELLRLLELLRVLALLRLDWLDLVELDRVVICRPSVLELGAVGRELIDRLDMLLLGVRLVIALLELLLLAVRFVMARLDVLLLGARLVILLLGVRLVMVLLDELLLGALLVTLLLELRLDETLLERLDDDLLGEDLAVEDDLADCRLDLLLDRLLAAITGSQNNKSANRAQKTKKSEPFCVLYSVFCVLETIIRLLSSAFTTLLLFHLLKAKNHPPVTKNLTNTNFFNFFFAFFS